MHFNWIVLFTPLAFAAVRLFNRCVIMATVQLPSVLLRRRYLDHTDVEVTLDAFIEVLIVALIFFVSTNSKIEDTADRQHSEPYPARL